jgi:hypothetical protein
MKSKRQKLIRNPEGTFDAPEDVVKCDDLSIEAKIVVLESWQADLIDMQKAVEENMESEFLEPGETAAKLAQVTAAIARVREEAELGP